MRSGWSATRKAITGLLLAGVAITFTPVTAAAQDDARLRRVEAEIRALQRAVFPGGDGRYFTPEVTTSQPQQQTRKMTKRHDRSPANRAPNDRC